MVENHTFALNQFEENNFPMEKYTVPVITGKPDDSIFETLHHMQLNFIKRIIIVETNKPVGIVTERDINRFLDQEKTAKAVDEIPIKHVMKKNLITVAPDQEDHFIQCATRMYTFGIGSIIVVDDSGNLVGIVSKTDVTKAYLCW